MRMARPDYSWRMLHPAASLATRRLITFIRPFRNRGAWHWLPQHFWQSHHRVAFVFKARIWTRPEIVDRPDAVIVSGVGAWLAECAGRMRHETYSNKLVERLAQPPSDLPL